MRSIEEIEALLLVMGVEMFYVQQKSTKLWWAMVRKGHRRLSGTHTDTKPIYTTINMDHGYSGIYPTKEEALNAALDRYINIGETK